MKFCSVCGHPVERKVPPMDHLPRFVCPNCQTIHYENPRVVAGTLPLWGDQVLLCRRAIAPRVGFWTLPAGFLECNESTQQAAVRETWEEAGARVAIDALHALIDVPHIHQVHLFYRAQLLDRHWHPGFETLEIRLFPLSAIPWEELAFATVRRALQHLQEWQESVSHPLERFTAPLPPLVATLSPSG
ncbi:NUDIX hydrolase [Hydrogenophilus islandicus]